jgi:hypothetical protein
MLIDSIDLGIVVSIASGLGLLLAAACVDRYQSRRRDTALNAAYLARIRANRINSHQQPIELSCSSARFLGNSGDAGGHVVAAHYEKFVVDVLAQAAPAFETPRLMLAH